MTDNKSLRPLTPWKFREPEILDILEDYLASTYGQHYAGEKGEKIQVTEFIMDHCDDFDFLKGNIIKYVARYGKKDGYNRKDLLKAMHYLVIMVYYHDLKDTKNEALLTS